ncbi:MAG: hypothetical protein Q8M16_03285 [Pirellulaceae bacterium]|nr:hypothetical protein [Pirellulaceae bacterium]
MPIATRCTHCGKAYQVAESTVGKQVKCQACGKAFVVAAAAGTVQPGNADPRPGGRPANTASANSADSVERARIAKLEAEFGLQPLPPNPNQVFPSTEYQRPRGTVSPLANHIVEDPGFEDISEAELEAHRKEEAQARHEASIRYTPVDDLDPNSGQGQGVVVGIIVSVVLLVVVVVIVLFVAGVF